MQQENVKLTCLVMSNYFQNIPHIAWLHGRRESEECGVGDVHRVGRAERDAVDEVGYLLAGHVDRDRHLLPLYNLMFFIVVPIIERPDFVTC